MTTLRMWAKTIALATLVTWFAGCGGGGGGGVGQADTTPPQILQFNVSPSLVQEGGTMRAESVIVDNSSGIASVRLRVRYPNGIERFYEMQREGEGRYSTQWSVPTAVSGEQNTIQVTVIASDMQGNTVNRDYTPAPRLARQPPNPPW
jgi:hypothetical protein